MVSRGSLTCGFTAVSTSSLSCKEAEALQTPERRGFSVAIVADVGSGKDGAQRLPALVRGIHGEDVADRRDAEFVFVGEIQTVEAVDELRAIGHGHFFRDGG